PSSANGLAPRPFATLHSRESVTTRTQRRSCWRNRRGRGQYVRSGLREQREPMPRSIWRGAISFGLVNVPVKLYSAVSKKTVRFNQLHATAHARINMKRVCPVDGEEVPLDQIVKGSDISPDRYAVIEPPH